MTPRAVLAATLCPILIMLTFGYLLACVGWPFRACRRCHGTGKLRSPLGRAFRLCPRCQGTGLRLRIGRRVINHIRAEYKTGNR